MTTAPSILSQTMFAKEIAKANPFHLQAFGQSINDFTIRLINTNQALVADIDKTQSDDSELAKAVVAQEVFLFAIENVQSREHANLIIHAKDGEIKLESKFAGKVNAVSSELRTVADQFIAYAVKHKDQFSIKASEITEA